jgi:hypothetical protein
MRLKEVLCFLFFFILITSTSKEQIRRDKELEVQFYLNNTIMTNSDLTAKILIKNVSDNDIKVYRDILEGDYADENANVNLVVEKKVGKEFRRYSRGAFFDQAPNYDTVDKHERIQIKPKDSIAGYFHVDDSFQFVAGYYRIKCFYRNNIRKSARVESNWIYFKVVRDVYVKHYFNDLPRLDTSKYIRH